MHALGNLRRLNELAIQNEREKLKDDPVALANFDMAQAGWDIIKNSSILSCNDIVTCRYCYVIPAVEVILVFYPVDNQYTTPMRGVYDVVAVCESCLELENAEGRWGNLPKSKEADEEAQGGGE